MEKCNRKGSRYSEMGRAQDKAKAFNTGGKKFCNMKLMLQNGDAEHCTNNKTIESAVMKSPHLSSDAGPYLSDWIPVRFVCMFGITAC